MDGMCTTMALSREPLAASGRIPGGMSARTEPGLRRGLLVAVAALHAAIIAACCLLVVPRAAPPPPETGLQVVFSQEPPEAASPDVTPLAAASLPPPPPLQAFESLSPAAPLTIVQSAQSPRPRPPRSVTNQPRSVANQPRSVARNPATANAPISDSAPLATAAAQATAPLLRPMPAARSPDSASHSLAGWEARIRQAVQDAAIYPQAARLQRRQGRAQVVFALARGAVSAVSLAQSSQVASLDTAALAAVTRARMPDPPQDIGPQSRTMLVWVQFSLIGED